MRNALNGDGILNTALSLYQPGPTSAKLAGAGVTALVSAIWTTLTSPLVAIMGGLFFADLVLGVLKAIHAEGLDAFDWDRFARAFIKLCAAIVGIILAYLGDSLLHESGGPENVYALTNIVLFGSAWGFFWSGAKNLGYFFPDLRDRLESVVEKLQKKPADNGQPSR